MIEVVALALLTGTISGLANRFIGAAIERWWSRRAPERAQRLLEKHIGSRCAHGRNPDLCDDCAEH